MIGIYGTVAAGLTGAPSFAKNAGTAAAGAQGEKRTARVLDQFADRALVLHDLRIPLPGVRANIDHAIVSGKHVLLIDTKVWKPGFYWTWGAKSRRGLEAVPHIDKKTMLMAADGIARHLESNKARLAHPLVGVWPSSTSKQLSLHFLRVPGARAVHAEALERRVNRFIGSRREADDRVGMRMINLLNAAPAPTQAQQPWAA